MSTPTDGMGIYEGIVLSDPTALTRLSTIANGGFKLVMNYDLLYAHMTAIIAYINYAASVGMKIIVDCHNSVIWKTNGIAAEYPTLSADATAAGYAGTTDQGFTQFIVDSTKGLAGTWGYYVGDEVANADHAALLIHANYVSAKTSLPRLIIEAASATATSACFNNTSTQFDCCDVIGDDFYPVGDELAYSGLTTASVASGIQSYCTAHSVSSAMVLQAHSWVNYGLTYGNNPIPWPTSEQMKTARNAAIANMTPRVILWYSYYDTIKTNAPTYQYNALVNAMNNRNGYVFV